MKRPSIHLSPRAELDLAKAAAFLANHGSHAVALRFLDRAEATFQLLAERPGFGRLFAHVSPALEGLRTFRLDGFDNYLAFYLPTDDGVEVVRVLHGAQDLEALFDEE